MTAERIEVWALYAVRYTRFILVCFISCNEAPNPCSGYIFAPIPQSGRVCNLSPPTFHVVWVCYRMEGSLVPLKTNQRSVFWSVFPEDGRNLVSLEFGLCSRCVYTCFIIVLHSLSLKRPNLLRVTSRRLFVNLAVVCDIINFRFYLGILCRGGRRSHTLETSAQPFLGMHFPKNPSKEPLRY